MQNSKIPNVELQNSKRRILERETEMKGDHGALKRGKQRRYVLSVAHIKMILKPFLKIQKKRVSVSCDVTRS